MTATDDMFSISDERLTEIVLGHSKETDGLCHWCWTFGQHRKYPCETLLMAQELIELRAGRAERIMQLEIQSWMQAAACERHAMVIRGLAEEVARLRDEETPEVMPV